MRVLIVEDEVKMASLIRRGLREYGLSADVVVTGDDALWMAAATDYDAIVLDVMLPGIDGFETCRRLRASGIWAPVLMLTARDAVADRVAGLDGGADDYLTKPTCSVSTGRTTRSTIGLNLASCPTIASLFKYGSKNAPGSSSTLSRYCFSVITWVSASTGR